VVLNRGPIIRAPGLITDGSEYSTPVDLPISLKNIRAAGGGDLTLSGVADSNVLLGDDVTILQVDGGAGGVAIGSGGFVPEPTALLELSQAGLTRLLIRNETESVAQYAVLGFMTGAAGSAFSSSNVTGQIRTYITDDDPDPLKSRMEFLVNEGDSMPGAQVTILDTGVVEINRNSLDMKTYSILNVANSGNDWDGTSLRVINLVAIGAAGSSQGSMTLAGVTSGVVTVAVAAAAGTWTMTLPAAVGGAGEQLTDAAGNGVTSWAAEGSLSEFKDIYDPLDTRDALDKMLGTVPFHFRYREQDPDGPRMMNTGDFETIYKGVLGDEFPEVMHYGGKIFSPVSAFGYTVAAFHEVGSEINKLENRVKRLERQIEGLGADPEA